MLAAAIAGCGGGGGGGSTTEVSLSLRVDLLPRGTLIQCSATQPIQATLVRTTDGQSTTSDITCPSKQALTSDYRLSTWELRPNGNAASAIRAVTMLPAPVVLRDGANVLALSNDAVVSLAANPPSLEKIGSSAEQPQAVAVSTGGMISAPPPSSGSLQWRWSATRAGVTYVSDAVAERTFAPHDTGEWGALAASDPAQSGTPRFIGVNDYAGMGLGVLTSNRDFRDVRYVDLENNGLEDIVSNVYGSGCLLIALARPAGGYDIQTPTTRDGSCIGGHGETILMADFDGDGFVDIFVPTYERFYYLKNLGNGQFEEIAQDLAIAYPNYQPQPEGAAAVDIDQNGTVDIVVGSEILLNDGTGHFTPVDHPFGPQGLFDEGMAVADLDGDGVFDIVKNDPTLGPRIFWGTSTPNQFVDAGWMFGGAAVSSRSYGLAVGDLFGDGRKQIVFAGGDDTGTSVNTLPTEDEIAGTSSAPPRVCAQIVPRQFTCLNKLVPPIPNAWQDLVMVTDADGDGVDDLVARYGTVQIYASPSTSDSVFRIDLRDSHGNRTMYGRAIRAVCADDDSFIGLKVVDGGNGYMAQGNYVVSFRSAWCSKVRIDVPSQTGLVSYGPFAPGLWRVTTASS